MRLLSSRLQLSAISGLLLAVALFSSIGCQKWSLRQNMNAFFGGEVKDDWEPPVPPSHESVGQADNSEAAQHRNWWSKRSKNGVGRVVLPRDRQTNDPQRSIGNTDAPPKLPTAKLKLPETNSATLSPSEMTPELVAMGANPQGQAGHVVATNVSEPNRNATSAHNVPPSVIDTGIPDVDLDASLATLPPQYRDVVKRTLQAVKEGKSLENADGTLAESTSKSIELNQPVSVRLTENTLASTPTALAPTPTAASPTNAPIPTSAAPQHDVAAPASVVAQASTATPTPTATVALAVADNKSQNTVVPTAASVPIASSVAGSTSSGTWHGMIAQAVERLESELESSPSADESMRRSQEITLRLLYVAQRRLDDALSPIERMDAHEQEYVRHQMHALYEASNPDANPARPRHWSSVMMSQREATAHLAAVSNLEVRSVAFCTQVDGYGIYQKFTKNHFVPDQDVLLYCEIDNVAAEKIKTGYETQLQGSYEIRDAQGRLVADQELPMEPEVCMNHRRDYFMVYRIYVPTQIPTGNYELRLTIQDKKGGKYGHSSAAFEVRN